MKISISLIIIFSFFEGAIAQDTLNLPSLSKNPTKIEINTVLDTIEHRVESFYFLKDYVKVLEYGNQGLKLANRFKNNEKFFTFSTFCGTSLMLMNDTVRAKKIFSSSYEKAKALKDTVGLMKSITNFGNFNLNYNNYKEALPYYEEGIALSNGQNLNQLFTMRINAVYVLSKLPGDNKERMLKHLVAMENIKDSIDKKSLVSFFHLAKSKYLKNYGNINEAIASFEKTIRFAEENNHLGVLEEAYSPLITLLEKKGDYKAAYNRSKELNGHRDQMFNLEKEKDIKEVITKMNVEQYKQDLNAKNLESQLNKQEAKESETLVFIMVAASIVLVALLVLVFNLYSNRKDLVLSLQQKNVQYDSAKQEAERLAKVKTDFLSAITHELRTPLYGIIGISSILKEDKKLASHEEDIENLKFSADYLLAMINDLLFLNKLDEFEKRELVIEPFEIRTLVKKIIGSFEFMKTKNSNTFNITIEPDVPQYLRGDYTKLSQILINLISNSCKFTEEGIIRLTIKASNGQEGKVGLHFSVADNGIGISKEKQAVIFNEFTQDTTSSSFAGTGLGLAIVKRLLELHGADISLKSERYKGTEFSFSLIYEIAQEEELKVLDGMVPVDKSVEGGHVLIVDDNKINRMVTRKVLESREYSCSEAENGEVAVEKVTEAVFDLILMDLNMPVMDGFEAVEVIRKFDKETPIIALTAVDPSALNKDMNSLGFTDVITKPYDNEKFLAKVALNFLDTIKI